MLELGAESGLQGEATSGFGGCEGSDEDDAHASEDVGALENEIATLSAHIHAAEYRLLELIRRFDKAVGWEGFRSCAHWLAWRTGIHAGAAREKVRVARALPQLPKIQESFRRGRVSYSKVRAMTRVATAETEEALLRIAEAGTAHHLEKVVRTYRETRALADPERPRRHRQERRLRHYYDEDGMLVIEGRLPPEQGALVVQALRAAEDQLNQERFQQEKTGNADADVSAEAECAIHVATPPSTESPRFPEEPREESEARKADALSLVAELALANASVKTKSAERYQVMLHVPAKALRVSAVTRRIAELREAQEPADHGHVQDGPPLSTETARRLACDATWVPMSENADGEVLNIGRKSRTVPPALRRALQVRDEGCRFPGCHAHRFVDAHHIEHWADGGETKLDNLVMLCRFHHRLLHEYGYGIERRDDGQLAFRRADGSEIARIPAFPALPPNPLHTLDATHRDQSLDIDAQTIPVWAGDRLDMDAAMEWLGV